MRVDAHHHVWDLATRDQPWTIDLPVLRRSYDFDELCPSLIAHAIEATVLVQTICVREETPELLQLAESEPTIAAVVGWVDLTTADVGERIAELRSGPGGHRLAGLRHQVQSEPDPRWLCRDEVRRGLAALEQAGLVFDLLVQPSQLGAAIETVQALPNLRFILDHAGKPAVRDGALEPWASNITELATLPNVAAKLSGLVTEASPGWAVADLRPFADQLLSSFGPSRVMFGSDWPVCLLAASYTDVMTAAEELTDQLGRDERADIFGGTAARWYGIVS